MRLTEKETELIKYFRALSLSNQENIIGRVESLFERQFLSDDKVVKYKNEILNNSINFEKKIKDNVIYLKFS